MVSEAIGSIREGESIAEPLKRSGAFPPMVTHMIAIGEKSGQLEEMLENVAAPTRPTSRRASTALTSLLEPLMIVVMGGVGRLHRDVDPDAADPDEPAGAMTVTCKTSSNEQRIYFPWEGRGGLGAFSASAARGRS